MNDELEVYDSEALFSGQPGLDFHPNRNLDPIRG